MAEYDGLDEPMEGLATVGITVAARAIEGHARAKEEDAREREQQARAEQRQTEQPRAAEDQGVSADVGSEFEWRSTDKAMTPRQREVLTERGYQAEDLAGMSRRVASRHIGGELGPEDAHHSRGLVPLTPHVGSEPNPEMAEQYGPKWPGEDYGPEWPRESTATGEVAERREPVKPPLAEQQERQRRAQQRRGRGRRP